MYLTRIIRYHVLQPQLNCAGGATSQVGIALDGTGNFTGDGLILTPRAFGCFSAIRFTGSAGNSANSNTIVGGSLVSPGVTNARVLDFQTGNGNIVINADIEGAATAVNFANSNVFGNTVSIYGGGNTTDVAFGAGATGNSFEIGGGTTVPPIVSGTVPPNVIKWRGTLIPTSVDFGSQNGNIATTTIISITSNLKFRVDCYDSLTRAATTSSTLPQVNILYNDSDNGGNTVSLPCTGNTTTGSLGTTGTQGNNIQTANSGTVLINAAFGPIQYSTTGYASVGVTSMQYNGHIRVTYIGP